MQLKIWSVTKTMIIGLMGFEFNSPNKGCEALAYSFLQLIENWTYEEPVTIYNFTRYDLGHVPDYFSGMRFERKNISFRNIGIQYFRSFKECDVIFDVSMGDSFSDIYSMKLYRKMALEKIIAEKFGNYYVSLPQTYGPFYRKSSFILAKHILNNAGTIFCRDELSQIFLKEKMGIRHSILTSDMAFVLPYDKNAYKFGISQRQRLGINVSGLLYKGGFNSGNQFGLSLDYKELIDELLQSAVDKYEVHLIPHVVDLREEAHDDDYRACAMLNEKYPETILAPAFETPIQAKSYISNMDIFIGARMHSTIAAFSSGVITIPISYSRKFEGLFGSLDYPYVVNAKEESNKSAIELIKGYLRDIEKLRDRHVSASKNIWSMNEELRKNLNDILDRVKMDDF